MTRKQQSAFANPVLIGAVTVLVALVGVFLAYNANQGLPFVPTRELKVDIANGSELVAGNDVREGGYLIGMVSALKPVTMENGQTGRSSRSKLDKAYGNVPVDSTISIQPRSVLGLKYLDLHKGCRARISPTARRCRSRRRSVPVQFDDVFKIVQHARPGARSRQNLVGFGDTLASRGSALNDTIASLPALFGHLEPVARYLSDPSTELTRFFERAELVHGRGGAGGAGQRPAVREDGHDVRRDRPQPGRPEGDDRRVAVDRAGLDPVADRPAAAADRPDHVRAVHDPGHAIRSRSRCRC